MQGPHEIHVPLSWAFFTILNSNFKWYFFFLHKLIIYFKFLFEYLLLLLLLFCLFSTKKMEILINIILKNIIIN